MESKPSEPEWRLRFEEIEQFWKTKKRGERRYARRDHAPSRRSRRRIKPTTSKRPLTKRECEEVDEKIEELLVNVKLLISDVANSVKHAEEDEAKEDELETKQGGIKDIVAATVVTRSSTQCLEVTQNIEIQNDATKDPDRRRRHDANVKLRSYLKQRESLLTRTGKFTAGDLHARPPEPPEPPDRCMFKAEVGKSQFVTVYDKEGEEMKNEGEWGFEGLEASPEKPYSEAITAKVWPHHDSGKKAFSLLREMRARNEDEKREKTVKAEMEMGLKLKSMGQAQILVMILMKAAQFLNKERGKKSDWVPRLVDHFSISMGQAQTPINYSAQLIKQEGVFQEKRVVENRMGTNLFESGEVKVVGVGRSYSCNISIMVNPPLVYQWDLGGFENIEWDPGGIRQDEYIQESHITYACYGIQQNQYYQVLVASTLPESMRHRGTNLLHFFHVHHPMAKQAWDTRIDLLDTNSGALTESTRTQDKPLSISLILLKSTRLSISIEEIKLSCCIVTSLVEEITIWGYITFNDPLEIFFLVCRLSGVSMELDLKMLALKLFGEQRVIPSLQKILFGNSEWRELSWSTKVILAGVLTNKGTLTAYGNFFTIANWQPLKFIDRIIKLLTLQQMRKLAPYSNTLALRIFLEIHKVEASWVYITSLLIKCAFKKKTKWVVGNEILDTCDDLISYSIEDSDSSLLGMNDHSANHLISSTSFIISDIVQPTHHKQWNPGAHDCSSCFLWTMSCKQWDPGGRLVAVGFWHLHLEDKVNFEGEGVDANSSQGGQIGKIPKVYERKKWKPIIWGPQCKHSIDCNKLPTWQLREGRIFS